MTESLTQNQRVIETTEIDGASHLDHTETDFSPMWVLNPIIGELNEISVDGTPLAEFDGNGEIPPEEPVAEVVYESDLDSYIPGWQDHTDQLKDFIDQFEEKWHVTVQTYHYPRSRLTPVNKIVE